VLHEVAPLGGIAFLVSMVVVAYLAEKYYDAPLRRWTNARLKRERAAKAPARRAAPAGTAAE
jgi:peptidoglycan/LPS O-acetylase OafA/YrhL